MGDPEYDDPEHDLPTCAECGSEECGTCPDCGETECWCLCEEEEEQ